MQQPCEQPTPGLTAAASCGLPLSKEQKLCEQPAPSEEQQLCATRILHLSEEQQLCQQPTPILGAATMKSSNLSSLPQSKEQQPHTACTHPTSSSQGNSLPPSEKQQLHMQLTPVRGAAEVQATCPLSEEQQLHEKTTLYKEQQLHQQPAPV
uniref:Uncharacterized protein n=1 Tax=Myotis myotis TaxID=51298 RepID=A0A7J7YEF3_MYOMY|nr:hypothetical protein mMyoMyo1_011130 [Myotis myotis]